MNLEMAAAASGIFPVRSVSGACRFNRRFTVHQALTEVKGKRHGHDEFTHAAQVAERVIVVAPGRLHSGTKFGSTTSCWLPGPIFDTRSAIYWTIRQGLGRCYV